MAAGGRVGRSCWTCRIRRKRCDSKRPICGNCRDLEIICHSGEAKPAWMDGGAAQKQMSESFKKKIKQSSLLRRERHRLTREDQGIIVAAGIDDKSRPETVSALAPSVLSPGSGLVVENLRPAELIAPTISSNSASSPTLQSYIDRDEESQSSYTAVSSAREPLYVPVGASLGIAWPDAPVVPIPVQLGSVMIYLDWVFPFLFPFYQPSLLETGRQWLLGLLCQNEVSFHISASLSAYFFTLVPQHEEQDLHDDCKALVWDRLAEQMDLAVRSVQSTVSAINRRGVQSSLLERTRIMEEITQLLIVEVTVRENVQWTMHLTPALALFDEIFQSHGIRDQKPNIATLLGALPSPFPMTTPHHKPLPNTADQSALIFFVSLLLFIDVIASTALSDSPVLQSYHDDLLSSRGEAKGRIQLEAVMGCQNWVLVVIGDISALCKWKRDAKQHGAFSVTKLVNLATPISQSLDEGLTRLDTQTTHIQPEMMGASRLKAYYRRHEKAINNITIMKFTRIWACAAKIYLAVTLSGWQVNSPDIQSSVVEVLSLLQTIESPAQLRSLSWPITVAGCLALPGQEADFRLLIENLGQLGDFGTLSYALHIMESNWNSRTDIDRDVWDIAASLSILGSSALLL